MAQTTARKQTLEVLQRLKAVQPAGAGWKARCPAHDDRTPSLAVSEGEDGRALLHCHAGCSTEQIVSSIGLAIADLFPPKANSNGHHTATPARITRYEIRDVAGELQAVHVRRDQAAGSKSMHWEQPGGALGLAGVGASDLPLYGSEYLSTLEDGAQLVVAEGEKAADALRNAGVAAVGTATGANGTPSRSSLAPLARFDAYLWPDADAPGVAHMDRIAASLVELGVTPKIVEWPDAPPKGDAADFIAGGGVLDDVQWLLDTARPWQPPAPSPVDDAPRRFPRSDAGNGELFAARYADTVRWDHRRARWLTRAAHWWTEDVDEEVRRLAKEATRARYIDAARLDADERKREADWAHASESRARLDAMLSQARAERPIADDGRGWDGDPWTLGVLNGVLDLRTGELRAGKPSDRIAKHAPIEFDAGAGCTRFLAFLERVLPDREVRLYVQRFSGYCMTGDVSEQVLMFAHGSGANGKTTLARALMDVLGVEYAKQAAPGLLLMKHGETHPTEIADLAGARLVISTEVDDGRRLAESLVKQMTGGDRLKGRFMHADFFEFEPTHKLMLLANHKPVIRGDDHAIWRRVKLIPFTVTIPPEERDPHLGAALREEAAGILNWLLEGCLSWQRDGLQEPAAVQAATDEYRADSDELGAFISECCAIGPACEIRAGALWDAYDTWTKEQHLTDREKFTKIVFGRRMSERFRRVEGRDGRWYKGVGPRSDREDDAEPSTPSTIPLFVEGSDSGNPPRTLSSPTPSHTRENTEKASTTLHPSTEADYCAECGAVASRYTSAGTPACDTHHAALDRADRSEVTP